MPNTAAVLRVRSRGLVDRTALVALLAAALVTVGPLEPAVPVGGSPNGLVLQNESTAMVPGAPTHVTGTAGPGRSSVSFMPADAQATSFTVTAWNGSTAAATATGTTSPVLVWGLTHGVPYTFTVRATNAAGSSSQSAPSASVRPTGPVTNAVPLADRRRFINQSTSFSSVSGTASSRRPQSSESPSASVYSPASQGVPAGLEWRILWLRAVNCEAQTRKVEFFVQQEAPTSAPVAKFVQGDVWTAGQPNRTVAVDVEGKGGQLSWVETPGSPLIVSARQSIGARWFAMTGGASGCNWQFAAIEQPAGTGVAAAGEALPAATIGATFKGSVPGARASWRTVPAGSFWLPESLTATNCESGPRRMEIVLLGPGNITQGVITTAAKGSGPAVVPAGGKLKWTASAARTRLLLPEGWALGVRWTDMAGDAPKATCSWSATVSVGSVGASAQTFDAVMR